MNLESSIHQKFDIGDSFLHLPSKTYVPDSILWTLFRCSGPVWVQTKRQNKVQADKINFSTQWHNPSVFYYFIWKWVTVECSSFWPMNCEWQYLFYSINGNGKNGTHIIMKFKNAHILCTRRYLFCMFHIFIYPISEFPIVWDSKQFRLWKITNKQIWCFNKSLWATQKLYFVCH